MPPQSVFDTDLWPIPLRRDLQAHGVEAVWYAGLEALGYPPLWADTGREFAAVAAALME